MGDSEIRGLHVRVFNTGTRSWFVRHRGTGRREMFGEWPSINVDEARERAYEILRGKPTAPTVARVIAHYREHHRTPNGDRPEARTNTKGYLRFIEEAIGHRALSDLNPDRIRNMLRLKDGYPSAQNAVLTLTRALFIYAKREGWYDGVDPTEAVRKNRTPPRNRRVRDEERSTMLSTLRRIAPLSSFGALRFAAEYGCRIGEARRLRWSDIRGDRIRIPPNKSSPERIVPMLPDIETLLEECREGNDTEFVFPGRNGAISYQTAWKWWDRARTACGIEDIVPHDLRHERVTRWLMGGVNLKLVSSIVGHRDPATTLRTYQDLVAEDVFDHFPRELTHGR